MLKLPTAAFAAAIFFAAVPASAAVLTPDAYWTRFYFQGTGSNMVDANTSDSSWTVTLSGAGKLQVTDAFAIGDVFELFVDASSIGLTGPFDLLGTSTADPDIAFGGSVFSWLSYDLGPGTYTITGVANASPYGAGGAFLRVVTDGVVPEPATWAMLIAGFGLVGAAARRRRPAIA